MVFDIHQLGRQAAALIEQHHVVGGLLGRRLGLVERLVGDQAEAQLVAVADEAPRNAATNRVQTRVRTRGHDQPGLAKRDLLKLLRAARPVEQGQTGAQLGVVPAQTVGEQALQAGARRCGFDQRCRLHQK